ncbi:MAG: hypothetical protein ABI857_14395 [Acidobacteriota bacterium]
MKDWLKKLLSGRPHFVIGGEGDPYMLRWYVIPRNRRLNIYVHKFLRDDDDRALHDHPWWFVSLILKGGYVEVTDKGPVTRDRWSLAFRPATHRHRVELHRVIEPWAGLTVRIPAWTIVVTGRSSRTWGFWCPKGFVPWHEFVDQNDEGNIGRGCN